MVPLTFAFNSQPADLALTAFQASLTGFEPALQEIAGDFREMVSEQFATQGLAGGTPWAPLAPATLRRKRGDAGILYNTGALFLSLTDPDGSGHVEESGGTSLDLGTQVPYAAFQCVPSWFSRPSGLTPGPRSSPISLGRIHPSSALSNWEAPDELAFLNSTSRVISACREARLF